jgi:hypothetical protein
LSAALNRRQHFYNSHVRQHRDKSLTWVRWCACVCGSGMGSAGAVNSKYEHESEKCQIFLKVAQKE